MKNIHVLPTDKPSRLHFDSKLFLSPNYQDSKTINSIVEGRNIYITNDEEIKYGNYVFNEVSAEVYRITILGDLVNYEKKIILTTDQDLIKDGVQAIDDEFLEWFVKNPSCEEVKVEITEISCIIPNFGDVDKYKIIIPKEKTKQESLSWDELIREAGSEEQLIKILKLPHIAPLVREAMRNECKKK